MLSVLSWFAVKMPKNYTQTYRFDVEFVNLPQGRTISYQSDTTIFVEVTCKGTSLLSLSLKRKHLLVDYYCVTTPSQRKYFQTNIQSKQLKAYLIENLDFPQNTVIVEPNKIGLEMRSGK